MSAAEAAEFAAHWLPAWSGNEPDHLLSFYTAGAFYSDPAVPDGLVGHAQIRPYFEKVLAKYPTWTWQQIRSSPLPRGFLNYWEATIPVDGQELVCQGVCTVELQHGLIARNEVFFDRSILVANG